MALPIRHTVSTGYVPFGLHYLSTTGHIIVEQKAELFQTYNRYKIKNEQGLTVYYAIEEGDCCSRMCKPPMRSLDILDTGEQAVIHLRRRETCQSTSCFPFCFQAFQVLEVSSSTGELFGTVEQTFSWCTATFDVKNEIGDIVLKIEGYTNQCCSCGEDIDFKVLSTDKSIEVGKISRKWRGLLREMFSGVDHFGISFPLDLDIRMKAVLLGACFLIDYMYFESRNSSNSSS